MQEGDVAIAGSGILSRLLSISLALVFGTLPFVLTSLHAHARSHPYVHRSRRQYTRARMRTYTRARTPRTRTCTHANTHARTRTHAHRRGSRIRDIAHMAWVSVFAAG